MNIRAKAFTVIELLVVMAVILVLASLLLAVLLKAKAQTQSMSCKNHLRQIGISLQMYLSDYHRYPLFWDNKQAWIDRLQPYGGLKWTNKAWHCPAYVAQGGLVSVVQRGKEFSYHGSYAYNGFGIAAVNTAAASQLGLGAMAKMPSVSLATDYALKAPSEMYAIADGRTYRDIFVSTEGVVRGLSSFIEMQPYFMPTEETSPLHGKSYNMLFADTHIATVKRTDLLFPPRTAQNWNRDNQPHPESWAPRIQWAVQN